MSQAFVLASVRAVAAPTAPGASAPGQSLLPESTDIFTAAHMALIVALAVLVIIGIVYGARLRRRRRQAEAELTEHNDALRDEGVVEAPGVAETLAAPSIHPAVRPAPPAAAPRVVEPARPDPILEPARPTPDPEPARVAADTGAADGPVTQLKGLGPRVAERLAERGIATVGQLAALTDDEAAALDAQLGPFTGRMNRDRWQEQARFLAAGDRAGFEAVFGRLQ